MLVPLQPLRQMSFIISSSSWLSVPLSRQGGDHKEEIEMFQESAPAVKWMRINPIIACVSSNLIRRQ